MLMERRCKRVPSYRKTENRFYHAFKQYQTIALLRHKSQRNKSQRHQSLSQPCQEFLKLSYGKRVTFCISRKGSLTVEAALVLPLFFFAVLTLLNLMEVCRLQGMVNMSLQESGNTRYLWVCASGRRGRCRGRRRDSVGDGSLHDVCAKSAARRSQRTWKYLSSEKQI